MNPLHSIFASVALAVTYSGALAQAPSADVANYPERMARLIVHSRPAVGRPSWPALSPVASATPPLSILAAFLGNGDSTGIPAAISGETPLTSAGRFAEDFAPWKRGASDD